MFCYIKGNSKKISLTKNDYVAQGGEGTIYSKNGVIYKIYTDINKMIPEGKIQELSALTHKNVIKPIGILLDDTSKRIGFTMAEANGEALCKLFTNGFWKRENIKKENIIKLISNMSEVIRHIHSKKCLIVDGNEFNYIVNGTGFENPLFIDVDSYQTPSFPATAIMPSIRDYNASIFSELTDWFSFAIVSFQLLVGIHPFKGRHSRYAKNDIKSRVIDCVSVLNSEVQLPPTVRSIPDTIPSNYKSWYNDLFEKGLRLPPPDKPGEIVLITPVSVHIIAGSNNFEIKLIKSFDNNILYHDKKITKTEFKENVEKIYIANSEYNVTKKTELLFTPKGDKPVLVKHEKGYFIFKDINTDYSFALNIESTDWMIINNTIYSRFNDKLTEIIIKENPNGPFPVIGNTWNIMPKSSKMFSGIIYQDVLGVPYLAIPLPKEGSAGKCIIKSISEMRGYTIIDAKHDNRIVILTVYKDNKYSRVILKFDSGYSNYTYRIIENIDYSDINFITLENGVCVMINHDDSVEIFSNNVNTNSVNRIEDPAINSSMRLFKDGMKVVFSVDNDLYSLSLKK